MRHLHRQEYPSVITEGEKRREQREERGSGGTKTNTRAEGSRETEQDMLGRSTDQPVDVTGRDATTFLLAHVKSPDL